MTKILICLLGFVVINIVGGVVTIRENGYCIMYGEKPGSQETKPYNGKAKVPDAEGFEILKSTCPYLTLNGRKNTTACCATDQLITLQKNIKQSNPLLSRCPAALRNFYDLWCEFTCSPDQSMFLEYSDVEPAKATVYVTKTFVDGLYNSVKGVISPALNDEVLTALCGVPANQCTPEKFLAFIGQKKNGAPFAIEFKIDAKDAPSKNITSDNKRMLRCNETFFDYSKGRNASACSCQDCRDSCPVPPSIPPKQPPKYIMGIREHCFITIMVLVGFIILFLALNLFIVYRSSYSQHIDMANRTASLGGASIDSTIPSQYKSSDVLYGSISDDKPKGCLVKLGIESERFMQTAFRKWGTLCAYNPWKVIILSVVVVAILSVGVVKFHTVTNPVDLWSATDSEARLQKNYFDENFGPFYRTEQVIITSTVDRSIEKAPLYPSGSANFSGLVKKDVFLEILKLQKELMAITAKYNGKNVTLEDICLKPLSPDNNACTAFSPLQYWQLNESRLNQCFTDIEEDCFTDPDYFGSITDDWHIHFLACTKGPTSMKAGNYHFLPCMSEFGAPVSPKLVLGGYQGDQYATAKALILTFVVQNHREESKNKMAEAWEAEFISYLNKYSEEVAPSKNLSLAYSSERSLQDEIDRASKGDVVTILISYLLMFVYIAVGLGQFKSAQRILVDAKIVVGIVGVLVVLLSVAASLGFCSYLSIDATLIIIEVIPFLVLAVGVDNIFILVQAVQRDHRRPGEQSHDQIGRVLGEVGPSMLLSSLSESVAFGFGALSTMPAVHTFSIYAAMAIAFNFLLQITMLVAVVGLDAKRQEQRRFDVFCCARLNEVNADEEECLLEGGILYYFMSKIYAPFLMLQSVRVIVVLLFSVLLAYSACVIPEIEVGISQTIALPTDSFLMNYFSKMQEYLKTGAPVYFVVKDGYQYSLEKQQNKICGVAGCDSDSLISEIFLQSLIANYSTIALPASSWLDDYFSWLDPDATCCRILNYTSYIDNNNVTHRNFSHNNTFCSSTAPSDWTCYPCIRYDGLYQRPTQEDFNKYMDWYLNDNPNPTCAKGGHAAYSTAVKLNKRVNGSVIPGNESVKTSYFMSYHTVSKTSEEFTNCLKYAREMASNMSKSLGHEVFPYSVFYVFYEQYLTVTNDTWKDLLICLAAIFFVTFLLMGFNIGLALCICVTIAMIIVDLMGLMYLWNIPLNAVSLVNLVMATGISVEFCSHVARAFSTSPYASRKKRAQDALGRVGSSVLSGITITKLVGVFVLRFSKSDLFEVFYFRMYMGIILFGAIHGLIFLPVLLSYVGPESRATEEDVMRVNQLKMQINSGNKKNAIVSPSV